MLSSCRGASSLQAPTILLVEDEALIVEILTAEFADTGFEVVVASDGNRAITELEADVARFKAVVTDIRLGKGPDGWDVGRHARELVPDMSVVYVSGDSTHDWSSKGVPESVVILKPFAPAQLVTAVSTLITAADTRRTG
jgi:DNA-binding response OmpR family regulator